MRNLLAVLLSGNITSFIITIYLTSEYSNFIGNLYFNSWFIFLGHLVYALPFSFLIDRLSRRFVMGKFFIGFGMYLILAVIILVILTPMFIFYTFYIIPVAFAFPITFELVKKIPGKYVGIGLIGASLFTIFLYIAMYYLIGFGVGI